MWGNIVFTRFLVIGIDEHLVVVWIEVIKLLELWSLMVSLHKGQTCFSWIITYWFMLLGFLAYCFGLIWASVDCFCHPSIAAFYWRYWIVVIANNSCAFLLISFGSVGLNFWILEPCHMYCGLMKVFSLHLSVLELWYGC